MSAKLIRRHPHVFGDASGPDALAAMGSDPGTAEEVLRNWDRIKRQVEEAGEPFAGVPETLPALLYARKLLRRADPEAGSAPRAELGAREASEAAVGELLLAAVEIARRLGVDPELALRAAADRRVEESA